MDEEAHSDPSQLPSRGHDRQVEDENHVQTKKQLDGQKHVAFSELEKSGLLREASDEVAVIEASGAARVARHNLRGRPRVIAGQKRARAETGVIWS